MINGREVIAAPAAAAAVAVAVAAVSMNENEHGSMRGDSESWDRF